MAKNLFEKIWEAHEVDDDLIYVDLHLVHEVTSPQAFDGLRLAARSVRRPEKTLATADHNVPTDGTSAARLIADKLSRVQVEALERNCEEFGIPLYSLGSDRQGIVHVIGPELGATQPGMTIVCGDSHTATHGAFGALAIGIGTSEVEHVLATQCLVQKRPQTMRILYQGELGPGVTAKDLILATIGRLGTAGMRGHAVEYAGDLIRALSMENRMTICNMTIEGGGRAGMVAPDETTFEYMRGRPGVPDDFDDAITRWRGLPSDEGASFDTEVEIDAGELSPMVTWGTTPGMVVQVTDQVPDPDQLDSPADREAAERALAYMDLRPGTPMTEDPARAGLHRLLHQLADLRPSRGRSDDRRPPGRRRHPGDGRPGLRPGEGRGRGRGARRGLPVGRVRVARGGLLDVPGDEPRHPQSRRALRIDLEPELRGPPGGGRAHPPGQPEDGGGGSGRGTFRRHSGLVLMPMDAIEVVEGRVAVLDRSDVDTDQIIPKQFLKRIERTGFGEFLFYDWFRSGEIELESHPILVTGRNFGSGSSREHAVWALKDYGFDAVIAPSFSDIFFTNCTKNGLLPVVLDEEHCRAVAGAGEARIDLDDQTVNCAEGVFHFEIDEEIKHRLINGLDDVAMTLQRATAIDAFEAEGRADLGPVTTAL